MPQVKENFYENILFKFESFSCSCVQDIEHITPGEAPIIKFKMQSLHDKPILFGYAAKNGLVRIATNGTIEEENILGTLISLSTKTTKELIAFLQNNGFLFPINNTGCYEEINYTELYGIIEKIKNTVELMTAVNDIKKDYKKICDLTISLLFSQEFNMQTEAMTEAYNSCHHSYIDIINNPPTQLSNLRNKESFEGYIYQVDDSIYGRYELNIEDFNNIIGGYYQSTSFLTHYYKNIAYMYINYNSMDMNKKINDFLFHFLHDCNENSSQPLSSKMNSTLIEIAKFIIGEEINANLDGIHPVYDSKSMAPSWKVDSLLCAAYFSIFYLKPDLELYRPCENPRCKRYFLVKTTSTRKKFCSQDCCNRVTQDRYRKRKREKEPLL